MSAERWLLEACARGTAPAPNPAARIAHPNEPRRPHIAPPAQPHPQSIDLNAS